MLVPESCDALGPEAVDLVVGHADRAQKHGYGAVFVDEEADAIGAFGGGHSVVYGFADDAKV